MSNENRRSGYDNIADVAHPSEIGNSSGMKFEWSKTTMPPPALAWASSCGSLLTSAWVASVGIANGFNSAVFHQAQETFGLPGVAMAAAPIYVMAKSNRLELKRQVYYRIFCIITGLAGAIYVI